MDSRIIKTKKKIDSAFISLLEKNKFEKITVLQICKQAQINRGTFYLHYQDKYELLEKMEEATILDISELKDNIVSQFKRGIYPFTNEQLMIDILADFYKRIEKNALFVKNILSINGDLNFQNQLYKFTTKIITKNISNMKNKIDAQIPLNYLSVMVAQMQIGVIKEWLNKDDRETPEELARMIAKVYMIMGQNFLHIKREE